METTDTITTQFVPGCGVVELPNGEQFAEPIRVMTPREVKEREELRHANTTEHRRTIVKLNNALSNGHTLTHGRRINAENLENRCIYRDRYGERCTLRTKHLGLCLSPSDRDFNPASY